MAEAVISLVAETLGNLLTEEVKFLHGVKDQADQLHVELKRMQWFLKDAERRQNEAERVREWVSQVRDLAYQAENLLEHYVFKIESQKGSGVTSKIKRCVCLLDECLTGHQVGSEIESLIAKISNFTRSFHDYGIKAIMEKEDGSSSKQQQLRRTYSHADEEDLVGTEGQVEILARNLVGGNHNLVCIWGMGGLGKTTLAMKVYHHPDVRRHFKAFSWICVSQQWQTRDLLQGLIAKFMPEKRESIQVWRDEELVRQLYEFQKNLKCLVVLDDIWSADAWECIKHAFSIRKNGSKVLLTTRNREVATVIDPSGFLYEPRFLSKEESWELLQRKFPLQRHTDQGYGEIQRMEELGKEMIEHCGGLPLAVLVLRGILATKRSLEDWETVGNNIKSYLREENKIGQDHRGLHGILALSYNDLPYRLKPCFLYLSSYLEDAQIETESLYQIWMAEGMISIDDKIGEETMMDVAERYLSELSERCMVVVETAARRSVGKFEFCQLHDLMRDLCLLKAKEENFLKSVDGSHVNIGTELVDSSFFTSRYPRLAIHLRPKDVKGYILPGKKLKKQLRSFSFSVVRGSPLDGLMERRTKFLFDGYKMLRVLSIRGLRCSKFKTTCTKAFGMILSEISVPRAIGDLIHLRYFSLRGSTIFVVPSFISKLNHLQTLDLRCFSTLWISSAIRRLGRLKHLYLPDEDFVSKVRLDGLHNLEILENFHSTSSDIKVLSSFTNLRSLTAFVYDKLEDLEDFMNQVNHLTYLRSLQLTIENCDFDSDKGFTLLKQLFSWSGVRLNDLTIYGGRLSKLPEYEAGFLPNLCNLKLRFIRLKEDPMRSLEKLPNLKKLFLLHDSFIGNEMTFNPNGFLQLRYFRLSSLPNLDSLRIEEGAMPNLCELAIIRCEKLKMIPEGLKFISTLKELAILEMPKEFNCRVQVEEDGREGEDFDKVRHVPSVIFRDVLTGNYI